MITLRGKVSVQRLSGIVNIVPSAGNPPLQAKVVYPSHEEQIVKPDDDYYGLSVVTAVAVPRVPACAVRVDGKSYRNTEIQIVDINISAAVSVETQERLSAFEWEVVPVEGAQYGFTLNSDGYYESQNKGVDSSYAMCKIIVRTEKAGFVVLDCINYAESSYDFGLFSEADFMLSMDSTGEQNGVAFSFKGNSSANVQKAAIELPVGEHFICVKFRKDGSTGSNNDTLQFKIAE